jgi:lysophospholipase L1-like esterase
MAHFDPEMVQAKRRMAHRRNPFGRLFGAFAGRFTALAGRFGALAGRRADSAGDAPAPISASGAPAPVSERGPGGPGRARGRFGRFSPRLQRSQEFAIVMVLLIAAAAVSASLPGGWAEGASSSPSGHLTALASADPTPTATPWPAATSPDPTLTPADPTASQTPTPMPGPTAVPTKKPAPHVYTFVALGDSLTAWPSDNPWPSRLDAEDANLRLVHNAGVPGDTTAQMLVRLNSDVFAYKPEVLFILGGTNDLGRNISQSTTIANLQAIINEANAKGIRIDLMTIPPNSYAGMAAEIDSLNAAIVHLGNINKLIVIDIHTPLSTSTGVYVPAYTSDGLHFSELGAQVVANTIYTRIHRYGF